MAPDKLQTQQLVVPDFTLADYGSFFGAGALGAMYVVTYLYFISRA